MSSEDILGIGPRYMVELGDLDLRVIRAALNMMVEYDTEALIAATQWRHPEVEPGEVATNVLAATMTARDLIGTITELIDTQWD